RGRDGYAAGRLRGDGAARLASGPGMARDTTQGRAVSRLDPVRWEEVQRLFHAALELPPDDRRTFVERACDDPALTADVLAMLEADAYAGSPLDSDVGLAADAVLEVRHPPGRRLGPYVLGEPLGEGGTAVVYRAHRHDL